jgi:hypothetical protein
MSTCAFAQSQPASPPPAPSWRPQSALGAGRAFSSTVAVAQCASIKQGGGIARPGQCCTVYWHEVVSQVTCPGHWGQAALPARIVPGRQARLLRSSHDGGATALCLGNARKPLGGAFPPLALSLGLCCLAPTALASAASRPQPWPLRPRAQCPRALTPHSGIGCRGGSGCQLLSCA